MPLRALLLDLDGTLVDTNDAHTDAWLRAFDALGYEIEREEVARAIGIGGEKLVAHLLGQDAEERDGEALREATGRHFQALAADASFRFFEGTEALIDGARAQGLLTAICTAAGEEDLDAIFEAAPADLRDRVDLVTTASDVDDPKPDPDVIHAALSTLKVEAADALLVGDTVHDAETARRAGVPFVGLATWVWSADVLRQAGARTVYADPAGLWAALDVERRGP